MNIYATAVATYRAALTAAVAFDDPTRTPEANAARRREQISAARQTFLASRPALPQGLPSRDAVLPALHPTTADGLARMQHEQAKVRAMLDAGRTLGQIIAGADEARAVAIADLVEVLPQTLASDSGAAIVAEVRGLVVDRLAAVGTPEAVAVVEAERRHAPDIAWHAVMTEAAQGSDASIAGWSNVYRVDRDGYEAVNGEGGIDGRVAEAVRRLDHVD